IVIGGSTLLDTLKPDSDIDIIIIVSKSCLIVNALFCSQCRKIYSQLGKFCNLHDYIFGNNKKSLYTMFRNELVNFYFIVNLENLISDNSSQLIKIENARIPLFSILIYGVDIDVMVAPVPYENIPIELNLSNYENRRIILNNLELINELINRMNLLNDFQYTKSILMLNGYRIAYREKFFLIDSKIRNKFTNLLRAIKLWANQREIYSNIFGYLSGTILSIMATKICLIYPNSNLPFLLQQFFLIFSTWKWPIPLFTEDFKEDFEEISEPKLVKSWNLSDLNQTEYFKGDQMPIISSPLPYQNTAFNINKFTKQKIIEQMTYAFNQFSNNSIKPFSSDNFWKNNLFAKFDYKNYYNYFLIIICSVKENNNNNLNEQCGLIKTKIRLNLLNWVNKTIIYLNNEEIKLNKYLDNYHVISGYQEKIKCSE
ncbi:PAP_central domain-containing protein, partial [Meloidogyne graminicola]